MIHQYNIPVSVTLLVDACVGVNTNDGGFREITANPTADTMDAAHIKNPNHAAIGTLKDSATIGVILSFATLPNRAIDNKIPNANPNLLSAHHYRQIRDRETRVLMTDNEMSLKSCQRVYLSNNSRLYNR
jgi:hypothetical protein